MAQDAIKKLMGNRDAIRKLMAMDANGQLDAIAENARNSGSLIGGEEGASYNPQNNPQSHNDGEIVVNEDVIRAHSRMPRQILESFQKNPGKQASMSILGDIDLDKLHATKKSIVVDENSRIQSTQTSPVIDYSLLKTIINEAVQENVKKYMSALSKKLINEGVGGNSDTIQAIKLGEKFSFITKDGDIYEAKLTFKRNIND